MSGKPAWVEAADVNGGAEWGSDGNTQDGLYYYRPDERATAANWFHGEVYNEALEMTKEFAYGIPIGAIADMFADQISNCFVNDDCSSSNTSDAWKNPGSGIAVSPNNILFWDGPDTGGEVRQVRVSQRGHQVRSAHRRCKRVAAQFEAIAADVREKRVIQQVPGDPDCFLRIELPQGALFTAAVLQIEVDAIRATKSSRPNQVRCLQVKCNVCRAWFGRILHGNDGEKPDRYDIGGFRFCTCRIGAWDQVAANTAEL